MEKTFRGKAFVVGDHVDTDQIIPARYLSYSPAEPEERKFFGRYAMSGVPPEQSGLPDGKVPFVREGEFHSDFAVVLAGRNFGCGSSREHAPLALAEAGVRAVVARSYARIFYRNSVNGGYLVPLETAEDLPAAVATGEEVEVDLTGAEPVLRQPASGRTFPCRPLGGAGEILAAGGLFAYARARGMV